MKLIVLVALFTVAMSAPADRELIGGGVPHPKSEQGQALSQEQSQPSKITVDPRPIWEGGDNVKPWLVNQPDIATILKPKTD